MPYNPKQHHRRSIRWVGRDYAQVGAYFVTVCAYDHTCLFGRVVDETMQLNAAGRMVEKCWHQIPTHFPHVALDEFIVMPNHIHGILMIVGPNHHSPVPDPNHHPCVRANDYSPLQAHGTSKTVGSIIRGFKIGVTRWMRKNTAVREVWQRNYFEHVIRNEQSLHHIRRYIADNPASWLHDSENPQGQASPGDIDRGEE